MLPCPGAFAQECRAAFTTASDSAAFELELGEEIFDVQG